MLLVAVGVMLLHAGATRCYAQGHNRAAAADAYDRGTAAYLSGDYPLAAGWFETAHRLAPAGAALQQAIRAHLRTPEEARAATLALQLQQEYADQSQFRDYADEVLDDLAPKLIRAEVRCVDCELSLDGKVVPTKTFFVAPGQTHSLTATFPTGEITKNVAGEAGTTVDITLQAPAPEPEPEPVARDRRSPPIDFTSVDESREPLSPAVTLIAAGITVGVGLAAAISGVATLRAGDEFDKARSAYGAQGCGEVISAMTDLEACQKLYKEVANKYDTAERAELRSNVLLGASLAAFATTAVLAAFFTDWEGDSGEAPRVSFAVSPNGQAFGRMAVRF